MMSELKQTQTALDEGPDPALVFRDNNFLLQLCDTEEKAEKAFNLFRPIREEFGCIEAFRGFMSALKQGRIKTGGARRSLPANFVDGGPTDAIIREAGTSEVIARNAWAKYPSLRKEFPDFDTFLSFARSVADGRSHTTRTGAVTVSKMN